jgi:HEAT repeat protein
VFALANVKEEWARQLLEQIAVQDGQWVVRNAAVQALELFNKPNPYIPAKLPAPSQASWLIAYAARQGVGVPPDAVPIELLYSALEDGTEEEKIASLDYMRLIPNEEIIQKVYRLAASEHGAMKDAAMLALWYLRASGVRLTVTMQ